MRVVSRRAAGVALFGTVGLSIGAVLPVQNESASTSPIVEAGAAVVPLPPLLSASATVTSPSHSPAEPSRATDRVPRIALQAGHWKAAEAPDELRRIRTNGTRWESIAEWEINLDIAERAAAQLRALGYEVDVLPAVVPPGYRADLFIAVHADGAASTSASGFRVAASRRDRTGRGQEVARLLSQTYREATGLRHLPDNTRRMTNYYAFNDRRYQHSIDPQTIGIIIETGFITSPGDRTIIVDDPDRSASGIVAAVTAFEGTALPEATGR